MARLPAAECQDPKKDRSDRSDNCLCNHLRLVASKSGDKDLRRMTNRCRSVRVLSHVASVERAVKSALKDLRYLSDFLNNISLDFFFLFLFLNITRSFRLISIVKNLCDHLDCEFLYKFVFLKARSKKKFDHSMT